jgi:uncharacterized protein
VVGLSSLLGLVLATCLVLLVVPIFFLILAVNRYCPVIGRIFEERPLFMPLRVTPKDLGESVTFSTEDGLSLSGSYFRARTEVRVGVLVFCHEYLSDRWSYFPYLDHLRDLGYDVFSFDFRNHGESSSDSSYSPLQWVTDHEARDLRAALAYLRSRPDHDSAGFGLCGISRGGSTALIVAPDAPDIWSVVTDGAFPTRGTMTSYIIRWAEIYLRNPWIRHLIPYRVYGFLGWVARRRSQSRLNCRFPDVEAAVARLSPRPWFMIHGERDVYISPEIACSLFDCARQPKEMWLVPNAKHNRCRETDPEAYAARTLAFLDRFAPRRRFEAMSVANQQPCFHDFPAGDGFHLDPEKVVRTVPAPVTS